MSGSSNSFVHIENCVFDSNYAIYSGGAIYANFSGKILLSFLI